MPPVGFRQETEVEINRSRFITWIGRTDNESEARGFIAEAKSTYPDARHHCTAFIVDDGRTAHSSDDGEPSGTAGTPMLNALMQADAMNVTAVVTRYFGGIKLGAGGLARAYGGCVTSTIASMPRVVKEVRQVWRVDIPHTNAGRLQEELLRSGVDIVDISYGDKEVRLQFTYPEDPAPLLARISQGAILPIPDGTNIVEVPVE